MSSASFGSQLAGLGKAALSEAKRSAKMAALKARIEKLKLVDLNKAHYALGKKCYDLGLLRDQFGPDFDSIAELERRIKVGRDGAKIAVHETGGEMLKRLAGDTKMAAEAKGRSLKLKQLLMELGKQVAGLNSPSAELSTEIHAVAEVNARIAGEDAALTRLIADTAGWNHIKGASHSIASDTGSNITHLSMGFLAALGKRRKAVGWACAVALALAFALAIPFTLHKRSTTHKPQRSDFSIKVLEALSEGPFKAAPSEYGPDALISFSDDSYFFVVAKGPVDHISWLKLSVVLDPTNEVLSRHALARFQMALAALCSEDAVDWVREKLRTAISSKADYEAPTRSFGGISINTAITNGFGVAYDGGSGATLDTAQFMAFQMTLSKNP